jgi:hypothetical protein
MFVLTCTILLNLFRDEGKDTKYLNQDFHDCVRHSDSRRDLDIDLQSSEDTLNAFKQVKENALRCDRSVYDLKVL